MLQPGYTASKVLWTKETHPEVFDKAAHVLLPHDYINYWLTGRYCMEYGDASGTGTCSLSMPQGPFTEREGNFRRRPRKMPLDVLSETRIYSIISRKLCLEVTPGTS